MDIYPITQYWNTAFTPHFNPRTGEYDGEWWMLLVDIKYTIYGKLVIVPAGYLTNFGSVPKIFRGLVDVADESILAFVIHDYLYGKDSEYVFTKKKVDKVLYYISKSCGQDFFETIAAYAAVVWFGSKEFKQNYNNFGKVAEQLIDSICKDNNYYPKTETF